MSRIFEKPNTSQGWLCPICDSATETPIILVPIPGTDDGHICQAKQVHVSCANIVAGAYLSTMVRKPESEDRENGDEDSVV